MMSWLLTLAFAAADLPTTRGMHQLKAEVTGAGTVLYAVSVPEGFDPKAATPLVLVLHPGGPRRPYYGAEFARRVAEPALRQLKAIMIAPDCTERAWSDAACDTAATALIGDAMRAYNIDRKRVLVVGFSMGGRGAWHMAANHSDLFTAAIPMAASTRGMNIDQLGRQPSYVIHSRMDEVVPFEPAEENVQALRKLTRDVEFEAIDDLTHFDMISYVDALRRAGRWVVSRWRN
ncbi:MAG: dienelactone hydrolase family protein [Acidimicrobiia bacterium]